MAVYYHADPHGMQACHIHALYAFSSYLQVRFSPNSESSFYFFPQRWNQKGCNSGECSLNQLISHCIKKQKYEKSANFVLKK